VIRYTSNNQLSIEQFKTPFQLSLDSSNRWVVLAGKMPWDKLASIYHKTLSSDQGAPAIDARVVIGAFVVKHKMKLDDRETIEYIRENMYVQYFLGLSNYTSQDVFDRSLFTTLRYRLGADKFDQMSASLIATAFGLPNDQSENEESTDVSQDKDQSEGTSHSVEVRKDEGQRPSQEEIEEKKTEPIVETPKAKGKLKLDATVADQMIKYPTDLDLLNDSREQSERLIDALCEKLEVEKKPRTYRKKARQNYLGLAKKKKKSAKEIRKVIGKQLNYLKRNLKSIHSLLDKFEGIAFPLCHRDQHIFFVIQHIYDQQREMHKAKTHQCDNRIVNIYQPYVRPMVRGKAKAPVEFGAKLGVSEFNGYARISTLSWNAYHEAADLKQQVEEYRKLHGYYPAVVIADKIYGTRENRSWLNKLGIRYSGKPLGRPSKQSQTPYQKSRARKENGERNHVEGKFGQAKNGYNLNKIRARRARTSESWIACIFFVMNLIKFNKDFFVSRWYGILQRYQMLKNFFKLNKNPELAYTCNIVALLPA
jgi:IS5 family transposase